MSEDPSKPKRPREEEEDDDEGDDLPVVGAAPKDSKRSRNNRSILAEINAIAEGISRVDLNGNTNRRLSEDVDSITAGLGRLSVEGPLPEIDLKTLVVDGGKLIIELELAIESMKRDIAQGVYGEDPQILEGLFGNLGALQQARDSTIRKIEPRVRALAPNLVAFLDSPVVAARVIAKARGLGRGAGVPELKGRKEAEAGKPFKEELRGLVPPRALKEFLRKAGLSARVDLFEGGKTGKHGKESRDAFLRKFKLQ